MLAPSRPAKLVYLIRICTQGNNQNNISCSHHNIYPSFYRISVHSKRLEGLEEAEHTSPILLTGGNNVRRGNDEAIAATRAGAELESPGELSASNVVSPIVAATGSLVDGLAGRSVDELESVDALDGLGDATGKLQLGVEVIDLLGAAVSVGEEDKLGERVPVDVELDTAGVGNLLGVLDEDLVLRGVAGLLATVGLVARVGGRTALNVPFVRPVAVDVGADARSAVTLLTVLAPQTVLGVGVLEACRIPKLVFNSQNVIVHWRRMPYHRGSRQG